MKDIATLHSFARKERNMKTINIDDFDSLCSNHLCKIAQYANQDDVLTAFKESAERQFGKVTKEGAFKTCMQFKDKHDLALLQHGTTLPDAKERLYDVVVYCLLGLAILSDKDEELQGC